jgi:DNA-directed RNA polymerase III subunit RPC1
VYGDDNLNPEKMEEHDRPVDFERLRLHISQVAPCHGEAMLRPAELRDAVESLLAGDGFQRLLPTGKLFLDEIRDFFQQMADMQQQIADFCGIEDDGMLYGLCWNSCRFTNTQLNLAFSKMLKQYSAAYVEPGEAIGAMGAQSISEPGTQMTLKASE